ncbi:hypothetical protein FI667_g8883, partial [Globisporangium splendens]
MLFLNEYASEREETLIAKFSVKGLHCRFKMSLYRKKDDSDSADAVHVQSPTSNSSVPMKWAKICADPALHEEMPREQLGAAEPVDQHPFRQCCAAVLESENGAGQVCRDPVVEETILLYLNERNTVGGCKAPRMSNGLTEFADRMQINSQNHIVLNFGRRLFTYGKDRLKKSACVARQMISSCTQPDIKANLGLFLSKLFGISTHLKTTEAKNVRLFSLLPPAKSFVPAHITISSSVLCDVSLRIWRKKGIDVLSVTAVVNSTRQRLQRRDFLQARDAMWRNAVRVFDFETANRKFAWQITTNGYSASVLMTRPVTLRTQKVLSELEQDYDPDHYVAIDPGMRILCITVTKSNSDFRSRKEANRPRKKRPQEKQERESQKNTYCSTAAGGKRTVLCSPSLD